MKLDIKFSVKIAFAGLTTGFGIGILRNPLLMSEVGFIFLFLGILLLSIFIVEKVKKYKRTNENRS